MELNIQFFCDMKPCGLLNIYRCLKSSNLFNLYRTLRWRQQTPPKRRQYFTNQQDTLTKKNFISSLLPWEPHISKILDGCWCRI